MISVDLALPFEAKPHIVVNLPLTPSSPVMIHMSSAGIQPRTCHYLTHSPLLHVSSSIFLIMMTEPACPDHQFVLRSVITGNKG